MELAIIWVRAMLRTETPQPRTARARVQSDAHDRGSLTYMSADAISPALASIISSVASSINGELFPDSPQFSR
jgi:hypothetical protein